MSGSVPPGPAQTTLMAVAARTASAIRCVAAGYVAVQVVIWPSFYAAGPWRLAGPAAAVAWSAVVVGCLRRRWPGWRFAAVDTAVQVALGLFAVSCVVPVIRGDTASWLYIAMASQVVVPAWFAPRLAAPMALASAGAYLAGAAMFRALPAGTSPGAAAAMLLAAATVAWCGWQMLHRRAAAADAALASADAEGRAQYVVLSRNIERREHERLLHDTVLNTLTALTRPARGTAADVVSRCQHDVTLVEDMLGDHARPPGPPGLLAGIEAAAAQMRGRGLDVHVGATATAPGSPGPAIPAHVTAALVAAVREALANVASHARTGQAWVAVSLAPPGELEVTVRDTGVGFDPAQVDPARLGLRRSIVERISDCGGRVTVQSAPNEGTVVTLSWAPPPDPGPGDLADAVPAGDHVVRAAYDAELPRVAGMVAAIWQLTLLVQVLAYLRDFRQAAVPLTVWLAMLAAAGWLVPRARAGGLTARQAGAAIAVAVAAVIAVGWDRRLQGAPGPVDWSVVGTGWLLVLVAMSRPVWVWACGALLVFAAHAVLATRVLGLTPLDVARLAATAYTLVVILVVFAALRPAVRTYARMAGRMAALANRSAAERAAVAALQADRRRQLALLEADALPLLRGIADGTLDPAGREVRARCKRHAAALRQALAGRAHDTGWLLAGLEPALRAAQERGVPAEVRVVGDPGRAAQEVAGATLAAVGGVISVLPPHPVTLTVLASADDVELYMTFDQPPATAPDVTGLRRQLPAAAGWSARVEVDDSGAGCLEVRWRKAVPA
jgi:signal transduction histidine kinase